MSAVDPADVIADLLRRGHAVRFQVYGDSMHPTIREYDIVHVEPANSVKVGDVVLALAARGLTAHRVVRIEGTTFVMRGDNADAEDRPLPLAAALGVVAHVERGGRQLPVRRWLTARLIRAVRRLRVRR